jgi:hypothetical protein
MEMFVVHGLGDKDSRQKQVLRNMARMNMNMGD